MRIEIQKGKGCPDRLKCTRSDGSECESELFEGSVFHDLAHFVVEKECGISEGFWGRIAEGYSIADYDLPNEERPFQISKAGYHAEFLATLVQTMVFLGSFDYEYAAMLEYSSKVAKLPFPKLPEVAVLETWRIKCLELTKQWEQLPAGEWLKLEF